MENAVLENDILEGDIPENVCRFVSLFVIYISGEKLYVNIINV